MTTSQPPAPHALAVLRAAPPQVLFPPDVRALGAYRSDSGALRAMKRGEWGPIVKIGRRTACFRDEAMNALRARSVLPETAPPPTAPKPEAPAWASSLLARIKGQE